MAILTIPKENRTIERAAAIADYLAGIGVDYEIWETAVSVATDAPAEEILAAYSTEIVKLKEGGGYVTADVIDVKPQTQGLDEMLAKFNREHWHDDDEVRFIIEGRGLFHLHPQDAPVVAVDGDFQPLCFGASYIPALAQ